MLTGAAAPRPFLQVGRGQKLGESDNIPFSEMTVEDLLEIVRRLPPEASAVKAIVQVCGSRWCGAGRRERCAIAAGLAGSSL